MPVYCGQGIAGLPRIYIDGGSRGSIVALAADAALALPRAALVSMRA